MMNNFVDFAPDTSIFKKQWMPLEQAIQRVAKFEREFGQAHLLFACHAALPSLLTPELVNLIRINFLEKSVEWIAESDLLLSSLCLPIDQGIFEIEPQIRQVLLVVLQANPEYGTERLEEIAYLLHCYNESPLANKIPIYIKRAYQWISSAYLDPDAAVQNMFEFLRQTELEELASRTANYRQVGKTLAMLAYPLETTNLQVELEDLTDSTYLVLQGYEGKENLLTLLQNNLNDIDETTQILTSSVANWLLNSEFTTDNDVISVPARMETSNAGNISASVAKSITIFFSYSHKDKQLLKELEKYLIPLQRQGLIERWYNSMVFPDENRRQKVDTYLNMAQIILLLISPDFLASDYCYIEMQKALELHQANQARVVPILLRPVDWENTPFAHIQALPTNNRPITLWDNLSKALVDVATGVRRAVEELAYPLAGTPHTLIKPPQFPLYMLPYRPNPFFTDREETLSALHHYFTSEQAVQTRIRALTGLAGIGKTQIALEYAYRHSQQYQVILWLNASSHNVLSSEASTLADRLAFPQKDREEEPHLFATIKHWLQSQTAWLLILDQVDDISLVDLIVPPQSSGHVLLTTRVQAIATFASAVPITSLTLDMSVLFLLRRAGIIPAEASLDQVPAEIVHQATAIAQEMAGFPLALDQAGAYLEKTGCSLSTYLDLYHQRRTRLLSLRGQFVGSHPDSVTTTLLLAMEKVSQELGANLDLLRLLAFLHPDAIPTEMIVQGASVLGGPLRALASNPTALDEIIATLLSSSLIHLDTDRTSISIHRLVQAVIIDALTLKQKRQWASQVVRLVNHVFPEVRFDTWATCERYWPQAQHCATLIADFQLSLKEGALLLRRLGSYCYQQANYIEAETYLTQVLRLHEQYQWDEPVEAAQTLNSLAQLYHRQAHYQEAEAYHLRALELREQALGSEHPDTAISLHNLAILYSDQGQYQRAEQLYQRVLSIEEISHGIDHPETARILNNLALAYYLQGNYLQAEAAYRRTLMIYERVLPSNHPDLAYPLEGLGDVSEKQGKYQQAEALYRRAFTIREQALGDLHPETAHSMNKLAGIYVSQGRYQQAEALYPRALTIVEQSLGLDHPDIALFLNNLAFLANKQGQYQKAEDLYRRALAIQERILGSEHPDMATSLNNLALLYEDQGKYEGAEPLLQRALAIQEHVLGPEHHFTIHTRQNLRNLYQKQGKLIEGEKFRQLDQHQGEESLKVEQYQPILEQALHEAKEEVIILSPWVNRSVCDDDLCRLIGEAIKRGVHIRIGYSRYKGQGVSGEEQKSVLEVKNAINFYISDPLQNLLEMKAINNLQTRVLVCDRAFAVTGSINWLSDLGQQNRSEMGILVRSRDQIMELADNALQLLSSPNETGVSPEEDLYDIPP
jgi:tetratricopeptide (TPR) repeat protein